MPRQTMTNNLYPEKTAKVLKCCEEILSRKKGPSCQGAARHINLIRGSYMVKQMDLSGQFVHYCFLK